MIRSQGLLVPSRGNWTTTGANHGVEEGYVILYDDARLCSLHSFPELIKPVTIEANPKAQAEHELPHESQERIEHPGEYTATGVLAATCEAKPDLCHKVGHERARD